jgi:hypothetical protein
MGHLDIRVRPTFVNTFTSYTLTITVTPLDGAFGGLAGPDEDFDGVMDDADACPSHPGIGADGCTPLRPTQVTAFVDGVAVGGAEVHADYGPDSFSIPIAVAEGTHELRIEWVDGDTVVATRTLTITRSAPDRDGDGVADATDNCPDVANAAQADLDGDGLGDTCDEDIDGDGYTNERELAKGSDPNDPASTPKTKKPKPKPKG